MSFTRKLTLDVPSGPDPKPHRRLGSRFRGNDGLGISGENNHQASLTPTVILRLRLKRHECSYESGNPLLPGGLKKRKTTPIL